MNVVCLIVVCVVCCGGVAVTIVRRIRSIGGRVDSEVLTENDHIFGGFIRQHENRILAFLVEEEARRNSLERETILALRSRYGKELVRPAYDALDQLGKCGINPMDVTRLQKSWIRRNGGNPNAHPSSREVERILIERNRDKAVSICIRER